MVWWIDNYKSSDIIKGVHFGLRVDNDRIFQTGNIMFSLSEKAYEACEIGSLISTGVNIFNVDRTLHDEHVLQSFEKVLIKVENKPIISREKYHKPISLSVTMSVKNPLAISKRADFIILKDVTELKQVTEFRKLSQEHDSIPILLWIGILGTEATNELIKISNGIILDVGNGIVNDLYYYFIQKCFKACRPVFYSNHDLIKDYYGPTGNDRKLMIFADHLVNYRFQGVMLRDSSELNFPPTELILSLTKAVHIAESNIDADKDFYKKSFDVKTPALPSLTIAYAASLAAIHCGADAILVLTSSGRSAMTISFASPTCHIIAITTRKDIARKLHLYRRVIPLVYDQERGHSWRDECLNRIAFGTEFALSARLLGAGAKLVVLAPAEEGTGYCDGFQIVSVPFSCGR